ncbi:MAG: F0F1 ATP synthase subunit epsilon [Dehalococcoidia bacterium]|nr:MAG: F0F1 ATP synthase subunit epsilon [Dehalococcoidia bacterium]
MAALRLEIVTAECSVYSDEVDIVIAPGIVGQLAILPHHAPLMTMLEPGELCLRRGGEETFISISGGFLEVLQDRMVILADTAERVEEIDVARAEAARQLAQEQLQLHPAGVDLVAAEAALRRSLARLKVVERRRKERRTP